MPAEQVAQTQDIQGGGGGGQLVGSGRLAKQQVGSLLGL